MCSGFKYHLKNFFKPLCSVLKSFHRNFSRPPEFTSKDSPMLAVASIHARILAIFLGLLSTYGFYRYTVRDQLVTKLFQEAIVINTIRFEAPSSFPEGVIKEVEQLLAKYPSSIERAQKLSDIIYQGGGLGL